MADFDYHGVVFSQEAGVITEKAYNVPVATCSGGRDPAKTLDFLSEKSFLCRREKNFLPVVASHVIVNDISVVRKGVNEEFVSKVEKARKFFKENRKKIASLTLGCMVALYSMAPLSAEGYFDGKKYDPYEAKVQAFEVSNCLVQDAENTVMRIYPESVRDKKKYDSLVSECVRLNCIDCDKTFALNEDNPVAKEYGLGEGTFDVKNLPEGKFCFDARKGVYNADFVSSCDGKKGVVISKEALNYIHGVASGKVKPEVSVVTCNEKGRLIRCSNRADSFKAVKESAVRASRKRV